MHTIGCNDCSNGEQITCKAFSDPFYDCAKVKILCTFLFNHKGMNGSELIFTHLLSF